MEDTKTLVAGAASSQEQLAVAAQNAVTTIVGLSEVVKNGAASLGSQNQEAQVRKSAGRRWVSQPDLSGDADQRRERRDLRARRPDAGDQVGQWEEHATPCNDHSQGHCKGRTTAALISSLGLVWK